MSAPAKPLVSIIITSYNYRRYITTAVDSACAQSYPNVEIVVVDNCSTDGTVDVLRERYGDDPRVRIHQNETNIGELLNANRGLELSSGSFVLWLSADDWISPHHVERLQHVFEHDPALDVVYSGAYFANDAGTVYAQRMPDHAFPFDYVDARDELIEMFTNTCPLCWPAALFRRVVFDELGCERPENGIHSSDWELQIRIAIAGKRFAYLAEPSVTIRVHDAQATGGAYHAHGGRLRDFVLILELYIDHPGMTRLRGCEARIAGFLRWMLDDTRARGGAVATELEARVSALTRTLDARAGVYEPARVHETTVSVVLPVSRSPVLAERAIASVAAQTVPRWEIVFVDSAPYALRDWLDARPHRERIAYTRATAPLTPGAARNVALRMARGEYLAFLGEANTYAPDHLATLADTIARSGARAAAAAARLVLEQTDARLLDIQSIGEAAIFRGAADGRALSLAADALPLDTLLVHRSLRTRIGDFAAELPFLDDYEFVLRLERDEPPAFSGATTVDVRVALDLAGSPGPQLSRYLSVLDAVQRVHPAPGVEAARAAHRAAVERAIAGLAAGRTTPQLTAELLATLAGRAVRPLLAAQPARAPDR